MTHDPLSLTRKLLAFNTINPRQRARLRRFLGGLLESAGFDTFAGEIDGDKVYGRGTSDMKNGVRAIAVMAVRLAKIPERKDSLE